MIKKKLKTPDAINHVCIYGKSFLTVQYMHQYVPGDDWEHEEIFTDDDEAVGNDPEEREELAPEVPAPPEIKQVCLCALL